MKNFMVALRDWFLDAVIGQYQLQMWREEKRQREECERIAKKHQDEHWRNSYRPIQ